MGDINDKTHNVTLWNNAKGKNVDVVTDGAGTERLAVDANVSGGVNLQRFTPIIDHSSGSITVNTTDTNLITVTDDGKIDFIAIAGSNSTWEVIVEVDSVEIYRMSMSDLGSTHGLSNATNVPLWVETANKNFRLHANNEGIDFTSNFSLKARRLAGPTTVEWLVMYRTLV